eukprot:NODE_75_length_23955_cov_0.435069.p8 type:complete len:318 gc:universal NODE_75_length_23955_cov_0.435069:13730-12777(-)
MFSSRTLLKKAPKASKEPKIILKLPILFNIFGISSKEYGKKQNLLKITQNYFNLIYKSPQTVITTSILSNIQQDIDQSVKYVIESHEAHTKQQTLKNGIESILIRIYTDIKHSDQLWLAKFYYYKLHLLKLATNSYFKNYQNNHPDVIYCKNIINSRIENAQGVLFEHEIKHIFTKHLQNMNFKTEILPGAISQVNQQSIYISKEFDGIIAATQNDTKYLYLLETKSSHFRKKDILDLVNKSHKMYNYIHNIKNIQSTNHRHTLQNALFINYKDFKIIPTFASHLKGSLAIKNVIKQNQLTNICFIDYQTRQIKYIH